MALTGSMDRKRRFAVVGLGSIGRRHARLLSERPDIAVELCDADARSLEEAGQALGDVPPHESFEALLDSRPEMLLIATPHVLHAPMTCAALEAGIAVLCEKPMSDRLGGAREMARVQLETGTPLRIGFMQRFNPGVIRLKTLLGEGSLGVPLSARYHAGSYATLQNSVSRHQRDVFGALVMDFSHGVDLLRWLLAARPASVYAHGVQAGRKEFTSSPNMLAAVMSYQSPVLAELHLDYVAQPEQHFIEICGDEGWARLDITSGTIELGLSATAEPHVLRHPYRRDDLYRAQIVAFLQAVDGRDSDMAPPLEAVDTQAVIEAVLASLKSGQSEPVC